MTTKVAAFKGQVNFYECEHEGDLDVYLSDLRRSGARVLDSGIDYDAETGWVMIEGDDKEDFLRRFRQTQSADFSSLAKYQ